MADAGATGPIIDVTPTSASTKTEDEPSATMLVGGVKEQPWFLYGLILVALYFIFGEDLLGED